MANSTAGALAIDCPVCGRLLSVPILVQAPAIAGNVIARLVIDRAYLEAHWLTHGPHDGEPLPAAA